MQPINQSKNITPRPQITYLIHHSIEILRVRPTQRYNRYDSGKKSKRRKQNKPHRHLGPATELSGGLAGDEEQPDESETELEWRGGAKGLRRGDDEEESGGEEEEREMEVEEGEEAR